MSQAMGELPGRVRDVMRKRGVVRASVFGSVARGEDDAASDVDFLVELEEGRTLIDLSGLRLELQELLGRKVGTPGSLHPELRDAILQEAIRVL
jgi:predicted nucleotidyltransferase